MTMQHEIDAAYYQGLREGFDSEVAEDLGIPSTPESVERHIESAKIVAALGANTVATAVEDPRQEWIDSFHLSHPSSEGPLRFATPEERAANSAHIARMRSLIQPTQEEK